MACEQHSLQAYLDGELAPGEAAALEEHLRTCPDCAREIASALRLRRGMAAARGRFTPDPAFKARVLRGIGTRHPRRRWASLMPAAVATATIALLIAAFLWNARSSQQALREQTFREVADLHVSDVASANPVDVVSTDRHTVKPWFAGRIPFSFNLPEFSGTEFTLIGGRVAWLEQEPGAQLLVGAGQHRISVLIFRESGDLARVLPGSSPGASPAARRQASFNISTWRSAGLRFFVVSDAEAGAVVRLARLLQQANP
jgi:anti-sigma factor RsiW